MSLRSILESSGVLKRPTIGRDAQQGLTQNPFVAISRSVPCSVQPASTDVQLLYQQRNTKVNTVVYFDQDIQAQVNDRFTSTSRLGTRTKDLLVRGYAQQVDRDIVWRMDAWEDPPPAKPTTVALVINAPLIVLLGVEFNFSVTAVDAAGNVVTGYPGVVQFFSFTDDAAALPSPAVLTNGTATFAMTFNTSGQMTLLAQDTDSFSIYGQAEILCEFFPDPGIWDQNIQNWETDTGNWNGE